MATIAINEIQRSELNTLSRREQRRYWGFRRSVGHAKALLLAEQAEDSFFHDITADCGCPKIIIDNEGHQEGCEYAASSGSRTLVARWLWQ